MTYRPWTPTAQYFYSCNYMVWVPWAPIPWVYYVSRSLVTGLSAILSPSAPSLRGTIKMKAKKLNPTWKALHWLLVSLMLGWFSLSANAQSSSGSTAAIDTIAAIVNDDVITMRTLNRELQRVKAELSAQEVPLPDDETLAKQVLQHLITEQLIEQQAEELGIVVTDEDVQNAVQMIAQNNDLDVDGLKREVQSAGLQWEDYLASLRNDIMVDQLRFRMVDEQIHISESEIDAYLKTQGVDVSRSSSGPAAGPQDELVELSQIVIRVPESASISAERE